MRKNHSTIVCIKLVYLPYLYIWCTGHTYIKFGKINSFDFYQIESEISLNTARTRSFCQHYEVFTVCTFHLPYFNTRYYVTRLRSLQSTVRISEHCIPLWSEAILYCQYSACLLSIAHYNNCSKAALLCCL